MLHELIEIPYSCRNALILFLAQSMYENYLLVKEQGSSQCTVNEFINFN